VSHLEKLISHYQNALIIKPDSASIHSSIGNLYATQKEFERTVYHYIKSIQFNPNCGSVYYWLRYALLSLNWFSTSDNTNIIEEGILTLRQVIKSQPNFYFANVVLGVLLEHQGKTNEAIACYQSASYSQTLLSHPQLTRELWNSDQSRQPDFLILGFPKCGTTSLYAYLASHPNVLPAVAKEILYFTHSTTKNIEYYLAHFPCIADAKYITGEASPVYIIFPSIAQRVFNWFPNIKLIILLRNPADRTISSYYHRFKYLKCDNKEIEQTIARSIEKVTDALDKIVALLKLKTEPVEFVRNILENNLWISNENEILSDLIGNLYIFYIQEWFNVFPRNQILIVKSENLFNNPSESMREIHNFLGLSDYPLSEYHNFNPNSYSSVSSHSRQQLIDFFRPYNQQLEEYLDMKFDWK
jgi:tetratricopeptide (TPR) repeat protein